MGFKSWNELMENGDKDLLEVELTFSSMDRGVMHYFGEFKGEKVYCSVYECCVNDYDYSAKEKVSSVTQGEYVYLTLNDETVLNTH